MAEERLPAEGTENAVQTAEGRQPQRKNLMTLIREWPLSRKLALGGVAVIAVILFGILIFQGRTADYQLLYANLSEKDAAPVVTWLKGENIPYMLKNNGRNIWVPADILYETRLNLAASGLPAGGDVGFEVFDKQSFALTDYVQKVNYTRALQGELARTISSLDPVQMARVHLALPEKRLFKDQQKQATASVIVNLQEGKSLEVSQVQGIVHLVAGSITGLTPENITVVDSNGVAFETELEEDKEEYLSVDMLAYQQKVENRLEMRAQSLLDKTMGTDRAMVRVSATLDFSKVEKTQEFFDPDEPVIRSEQVNQQQSGPPVAGGIPGVESNLEAPGTLQEDTGLQEAETSSSTSRTTNYEISKTVSRVVNPVGTIQKLSVSVLVADKVVPATEDTEATTEPRSEEELQSLETMVSTALGLDPERGDQIEAVSMPFMAKPEEAMAAAPAPQPLLYQYLPFIKLGLIAAGAILLYFFLVRPSIKTMRGEVREHYKTVEELEQERLEAERIRQIEEAEQREFEEDPIAVIRRNIVEDPTPAAHIIKSWLQEA